MNITQTPLADIQPYGKNAKKHPEEQVAQIAASIKEFGFNQSSRNECCECRAVA